MQFFNMWLSVFSALLQFISVKQIKSQAKQANELGGRINYFETPNFQPPSCPAVGTSVSRHSTSVWVRRRRQASRNLVKASSIVVSKSLALQWLQSHIWHSLLEKLLLQQNIILKIIVQLAVSMRPERTCFADNGQVYNKALLISDKVVFCNTSRANQQILSQCTTHC